MRKDGIMDFSRKNRMTSRSAFLAGCIFIFFSISFSEIIVAPSAVHTTIAKALFAAKPGDTVVVENGVYGEKVQVKAGVFLKARSPFKSILDGKGKGTVVTLDGNAGICGFEIRGGTIGVASNNIENVIMKCRITAMTESGISCSGQLPTIEDNVIVYNKGSGIQGWNLQSASASINHNTIAYNANNGVAFGGNSTVNLDNNIIANNQRLGLKTNDETVVLHLIKNVFFENGSMSYIIKLDGNFTCDPRFVEPKKMNFAMQADSPCKHKAANDEDPGARGGF
jgi:hypothetical protein